MVRNSHLDLMDQDILYHLALGSGSHDLRAMFGDVKVVINNYIFVILLWVTIKIEITIEICIHLIFI